MKPTGCFKYFVLKNQCNFLFSQFFVMPQKSFINGIKTFTKAFSGSTRKSEN